MTTGNAWLQNSWRVSHVISVVHFCIFFLSFNVKILIFVLLAVHMVKWYKLLKKGFISNISWKRRHCEIRLSFPSNTSLDRYNFATVEFYSLLLVTPSWWRHQIETFSALLAICAGNSPVPVNYPHKGQWRGALMFSLICARSNRCVNNGEAGDLRHRRSHYDVTVMFVVSVLYVIPICNHIWPRFEKADCFCSFVCFELRKNMTSQILRW